MSSLTQAQAEAAIAIIRGGTDAANVIRSRGRAIHQLIRAFQRVNGEAFERLIGYRRDYLGDVEDYWPNVAIYALDTCGGAWISPNGITIETSTRYPGDDHRYLRFEVPVEWLWASADQINERLAAELKEQLIPVSEHEARAVEQEEDEARRQYESLKERFEQGT